jgi:membrane fusion protein, macrolide-specific efflux system
MKKKRILLFLGLFALVGGAYLVYSILNKDGQAQQDLQTTLATRGDIENVVTATGKLQPRDYVDVGAQVSGQLKYLHVDVGDTVKKGDLLAEIDVTLFMPKVDATRAQLRYQEASLLDKKAQFELARIQYERQKNMYAHKATSLEALQNAEISLKSAQAHVAMLEAQIEQTSSSLRAEEANLEFTRIYAPMDGTVVSLSSKQGQTLNANQQAPTILRIADLSVMTIKAEVSEADVMRLEDQMEVYFKTLGREKKWFSTLHKVEPTPTITNNVVLYNALFDVDNKKDELMSEMTAQVFFVLARANDVVLLPLNTIHRENPRAKKGSVELLLEDGSRQVRDVELGVSNRVMVEIRSGLNEGDKVLVPQKKKSNNQRVRMPRIM